jgi:stage IV sporulation protein B
VIFLQRRERKKKLWSLIGICLTLIIAYSTPFHNFASFPNEVKLFEGSTKQLSLSLPANALVTAEDPNILDLNEKPFTIIPKKPGETKVQVKVGNFPIKTLNVRVYPDIRLIPGGQSIGVKLQSAGILVVGHKTITSEKGKRISPAEEANIQVGDMITSINGKKVNDANKLGEIVNEAGKKGLTLKMELLRGKEKINVVAKPVKDTEDNQYKLGLYVRDSAAGVGTMTFYDPKTRVFGALGHVISDLDTQKPIVIGNGKIVPSTVTSIDRGEEGKPGSIRAVFPENGEAIGSIEKNTPFGIYGTLHRKIKHPLYNEALPIAFVEQVKEGPAEILTVVEGDKIERFSIEIVNVIKQRYPSTKGMIIRVTDPRLLEKTGGIVQGMSGSPIIQDGRLVGAITHVFVNDPTQGYGLFIEWMIDEANINFDKKSKAG